MPLFATGHARFNLSQVVLAMAETLRDQPTAVQHVFIVVYDRDRAEEVAQLIRSVIPDIDIDMQRGPDTAEEALGWW